MYFRKRRNGFNDMTQDEINRILQIGVELSSERDTDRLLEHILDCVMELAHCDAGTLYLYEDGMLQFRLMKNNSRAIGTLPPVPLKKEHVCALAYIEGSTLNIGDVYESELCDFSGAKKYDEISGYRTKSMLVVPMCSREGEKLGVLQLINATGADGVVCPFPDDMALVLESVASQAAITIRNVRYIKQIREMFHSFVRMLSTAVDERTPYNASHTRHMAENCGRFIDYLNEKTPGRFSPERKEEILMSVWLHDIGKLVTPLEVMNKSTRLTPELRRIIEHRFEIIGLRGEIEYLRGTITSDELENLKRELDDARRLINDADAAGFQTDERLDAVKALSTKTYSDGQNELPWLTEQETELLSIRRGTLSDEEREIMNAHVILTDKLLSDISFPDDLSHVRAWASMHHEFLNGEGYPSHLSGSEIPEEVRIITILDIFDALVASDRPYKKGMPVDRALGILTEMVEKEHKLDAVLTRDFIESRCWESEKV